MVDFLSGILIGFVFGSFVVFVNIANTDTEPQEQEMIDKCQQINSELESYNWTTFKCKNGATFEINEQ